MAQTGEGSKRLGMILFIFLLLTCMYAVEGLIITAEDQYSSRDPFNTSFINDPDTIPDYENYSSESDIDGPDADIDILGMITGFFKFASFTAFADMHPALVWFFAIFATCVYAVLTFLVYQFIRDWVPFV